MRAHRFAYFRQNELFTTTFNANNYCGFLHVQRKVMPKDLAANCVTVANTDYGTIVCKKQRLHEKSLFSHSNHWLDSTLSLPRSWLHSIWKCNHSLHGKHTDAHCIVYHSENKDIGGLYYLLPLLKLSEVLKWTFADQWLLKRCLGSVRGTRRFCSFIKGTRGGCYCSHTQTQLGAIQLPITQWCSFANRVCACVCAWKGEELLTFCVRVGEADANWLAGWEPEEPLRGPAHCHQGCPSLRGLQYHDCPQDSTVFF